MYQYFSDTAKEVLKIASKIAKVDSREYIGTEDVLLAILEHGVGLGAQILQKYSISLYAVQDQIHLLRRGANEETWIMGRLPGTPNFKQVIARAMEEAEVMRDTRVGTEYLLLGILREKGCMAERVLGTLGIKLSQARQELAAMRGRPMPLPKMFERLCY